MQRFLAKGRWPDAGTGGVSIQGVEYPDAELRFAVHTAFAHYVNFTLIKH